MAGGGAPTAKTGLRWLLIFSAIGWPTAGLLVPAVMAWVLLVLGAVAAAVGRPQISWNRNGGWIVVAILAGLLAWSLTSTWWSIQPEVSAWRAAKLATLLLAALLIFITPLQSVRGVGMAQAIGLALAAALILFEVPSDMVAAKAIRRAVNAMEPEYLFYYNRGATILALAVWPAIASLLDSGQRWVAILCVAAAGAGVFLLDSDAARIGIVAGFIVFGLTLLQPIATNRLLMASVALCIITAPFLAVQIDQTMIQRLPPSVQASHLHRALIWKFVGTRALERPIIGWGLGASRVLPGGTVNLQDTVNALPLGPEGDELKKEFREAKFEQLPLHPHSVILQVWVELGVVGATLLLATIASALVIGRQRYTKTDLAAFHALLLTFLVIANLSYGAWQSWWLAALALALILLHTGVGPPPNVDPSAPNSKLAVSPP